MMRIKKLIRENAAVVVLKMNLNNMKTVFFVIVVIIFLNIFFYTRSC